jgi:hypothetical protein
MPGCTTSIFSVRHDDTHLSKRGDKGQSCHSTQGMCNMFGPVEVNAAVAAAR